MENKNINIKFEDLLGKNVKEVMENLRKQKICSRIVEEDGEPFIITQDLDPNRYNFVVKEGKIISVKKF